MDLSKWENENPELSEWYAGARKIVTAHKKLSENIRKVGKTYFIWDSNIFQSFVKEIKYFAGLNLISTSDVMCLKNELQQLLTDLENLSIKGEFSERHELYIYLSNIDFEATYSYLSRKDFQISLFRVYSINSMDSQSPQICLMQKNWIQSLKDTLHWFREVGKRNGLHSSRNKGILLKVYKTFLLIILSAPRNYTWNFRGHFHIELNQLLLYSSHTTIINPTQASIVPIWWILYKFIATVHKHPVLIGCALCHCPVPTTDFIETSRPSS